MSNKEYSIKENPVPLRLQEYRLKKEYVDIIIQVGAREFPAHRIVLADSSSVLKRLFSDHWSLSSTYMLNNQQVSSDVFDDVLTFLYTGKVNLNVENAHALCIAADYLDIQPLLGFTEDFLGKNLQQPTVYDLLFFADKLKLENLRKDCINFVTKNAKSALTDPKVVNFSIEELMTLLNDVNKLNKRGKIKESLFECVNIWVEHDYDRRSESTAMLLKSIPLDDLTPDYLQSFVRQTRIVSESVPCLNLWIEAFQTASTRPAKPEVPEKPKDSKEPSKGPKKGPRAREPSVSRQTSTTSLGKGKIFCFGGVNSDNKYQSSVSVFSKGQWSSSKDMSAPKIHFSGVQVGSKVYLYGGQGLGKILDTFECFDCPSQSWKVLRNILQPRRDSAAAALGDFIYIAGGRDDSNSELATVIRYSIKNDEWRSSKSMIEARNGHQLVALNGRLYAIGGHKKRSVEEYDPQADRWTMKEPTDKEHWYFGAVAHNGRIYIASGSGFEFYIPEANTWKAYSSGSKASGKVLLSAGGKLLSVGGGAYNTQSKKFESSNQVAEYDESNRKWKPLSGMDAKRMFHCAFYVDF